MDPSFLAPTPKNTRRGVTIDSTAAPDIDPATTGVDPTFLQPTPKDSTRTTAAWPLSSTASASPAASAASASSAASPLLYNLELSPFKTCVKGPAASSLGLVLPDPAASWVKNLGRSGGFWGDAQWYDLQLERRLPLVRPMMTEMVFALPPLSGKNRGGSGCRVLDICAGSGRASAAIAAAYPSCRYTLVDQSEERLAMAVARLASLGVSQDCITTVSETVMAEDGDRDGYGDGDDCPVGWGDAAGRGEYDAVVACLAIRNIVDPPLHYADKEEGGGEGKGEAAAEGGNGGTPTPLCQEEGGHGTGSTQDRFLALFRMFHAALRPGGHLVIPDHVGKLGCFATMALLVEAGFADVDVAWRERDFYVIGGRRPC